MEENEENKLALNLSWGGLEELPKLPLTLTRLYCHCNNLNKLPTLPDLIQNI